MRLEVLSACIKLVVGGVRYPDRGRKTWPEFVDDDLRGMGFKREDALVVLYGLPHDLLITDHRMHLKNREGPSLSYMLR